ncbi:MAG: hypothetical protein LBH80_02220 [Prevotellaceae bacterium]|jgi:hypothetical protein|nr:hypothetical protein [Prevotellaceae bacterium]
MIHTVKIDDTTAAGKRFMRDFRRVRKGIEQADLSRRFRSVAMCKRSAAYGISPNSHFRTGIT